MKGVKHQKNALAKKKGGLAATTKKSSAKGKTKQQSRTPQKAERTHAKKRLSARSLRSRGPAKKHPDTPEPQKRVVKSSLVETVGTLRDEAKIRKKIEVAKGLERSLLFKQLKSVKKESKAKLRRERRAAEARGEKVERVVPKTIEMMREAEDSFVDDDLEVVEANNADEFKNYFMEEKSTPKLLVTTGRRASRKLRLFLNEFTAIIPNCCYIARTESTLSSLVEFAKSKEYTDIIIFTEKRKMPFGMYVAHLPDGPTSFFRWTGLTLAQDIVDTNTAVTTDHLPELIFKNFKTRCGERVSRQLHALFPYKPEFLGRRAIVFHNQRDFIFFRHYRYIFDDEGKNARLQEIGPRFTLKLRFLQEGPFDIKEGKYEFHWRPDSQVSRKRFFL